MSDPSAEPSPAEPPDLLQRMRLLGLVDQTDERLVQEELIARECRDRSITVNDSDLQAAFEAFRRERGLLSADDFHGWLSHTGIDLDAIEAWLEAELLRDGLARAIVPDAEIEEFTRVNPWCRVTAVVKRIALSTEDAARQVRWNLVIEEDDPAEQASLNGSDLALAGPVTVSYAEPTDWPPNLRRDCLTAERGEVLGPTLTGDVWMLSQIADRFVGPVDERLKDQIRADRFEHWLTERITGRV